MGNIDPAEIDGPSAEWYRELAETSTVPWPRGVYIARLSHTAGFALARAHMAVTWPCGRCGGPRVCPDLPATLAYRCGYAPADPADVFGRWVHQ